MNSKSERNVPNGMSPYLYRTYPNYIKNKNLSFKANILDQIETSVLLNCANERINVSRFKYDYFINCDILDKGSYKSTHPYVHRYLRDIDPAGSSQKQIDLEVQVRVDIAPPYFSPFKGYSLAHFTDDGMVISSFGSWLRQVDNRNTASFDHDDDGPCYANKFDADKILKAYIEHCDDRLQEALPKPIATSDKRKSADPSTAPQLNSYSTSIDKSRKRNRPSSPPPKLLSPAADTAQLTSTSPLRKKPKGRIDSSLLSSSSVCDSESDDGSKSSHSESDSDDSACGADDITCHDSSARHSDSSKTSDLSTKKRSRKSQPKCSRSKAGCQGEHSKQLVDKYGARMKAFRLFFKQFCEHGEGKVQAGVLQKLNQSLSTGDPMKLTLRELGQCCAARLCKTKPGGQTWYHGLILRTQAPADAGKSRTSASID